MLTDVEAGADAQIVRVVARTSEHLRGGALESAPITGLGVTVRGDRVDHQEGALRYAATPAAAKPSPMTRAWAARPGTR